VVNRQFLAHVKFITSCRIWILDTGHINTSVCMQMFNCPSVDLTVAKRKVKFLTKYCHNENSLCSVYRNRASSELDEIVGLNVILYQLINLYKIN